MEEALIKRVMPHSIEAEQSVVGAMLMDKDAITTAGEIISGDDFYQEAYGVIFDSMIELFNEGKPVDLITLQKRLKEKDVPAEIASLEFVRDLVTAVPTSANVKYYAQIVADKSLMRKMIKLNESIENMCYAGKEPVESIMEQTEKSMFQLFRDVRNGDYVPIKQVVLNALIRLRRHLRVRELLQEFRPDLLIWIIRLPASAVRFYSDRSPSIYGKNGVCTEHCAVYGI